MERSKIVGNPDILRGILYYPWKIVDMKKKGGVI